MLGLWPISLVMFAGLYTWLGMFILTRDRQNSRSWFVMLAFIALAVWYFSTAMVHVTQGNSFGRTLWFRISLAAIVTAYTLWFQATVLLSLALFRPNHPRRWLGVGLVVVISGLALAVISSLTDLVLHGRPVPAITSFGTCSYYCLAIDNPVIQAIWVFTAATDVTMALVYSIAYWKERRANRPTQVGFLWLAAASYLFLIARLAVFGVQANWLSSHTPAWLSAISALMIGWGIGKYNALVKGRVIERDALRSFIEFLLILAGYVILPVISVGLLQPSGIADKPINVFQMGLLTLLAVLTHTTLTQVRGQIDLRVSADPTAQLRHNVANLLQDSQQGAPLVVTVNALDLTATRALIDQYVDKQMLRRLDMPDSLEHFATHPLQSLSSVTHLLWEMSQVTPITASRRERASALLQLLRNAMKRVEADANAGWLHHDVMVEILRLRLNEGFDRLEIVERLNLHPRTYDRLLDQGVQQLAAAIFELERENRQPILAGRDGHLAFDPTNPPGDSQRNLVLEKDAD